MSGNMLNALQAIKSGMETHRQEVNTFRQNLSNMAIALDEMSRTTTSLEIGLEEKTRSLAGQMLIVNHLKESARHDRIHGT
jgi:hypothetical protein